jgi:hypothetical protein
MPSLPHSEDPRFGKQLKRLEHFHQFICEVAGAVLQSKDYESVWSITNRVYDRHCSSTLSFLGRLGPDESGMAALRA